MYTGAATCNGMECQRCRPDTTVTDIECVYNPQQGQYLNKVHRYGIRDCMPFDSEYEYYSDRCDTTSNDSTLQCLGSFDGVHVQVRNPASGKIVSCKADGSCSAAIRMILSGECENPFPQSSSADGGSSSSTPESSSSSEDGSSSSEDGPPASSGSNDWEQWMKDSLGHIDANIEWSHVFIQNIYDGVNELNGTAHEINTNTRNTAENTASIDGKLTTTNSLLNSLNEKDFSPDVTVNNTTDVSGVIGAQNATTDTLHNTNALLGGIADRLGGIDSAIRNPRPDSARDFWNDRNNRTFSNAGLDTNGWGAVNDTASRSADSAIAGGEWLTAIGCDTTGGRRCDNALIGAHGLDSARSGIRAAYGELGDSLQNGAFADSLNAWGNKFTNGKLSGNGSNSCPSVMTRTHTIHIGSISVDFEGIGKYLCAPVFGGVTAWTLARLVIRAVVALACMWFLFKCAVGFGGGDDE